MAAAAATYFSPPLASSSSSSSSSSLSITKKHSSFSISLNKWNHQLGIPKFSTWNGLRHLGLSTSPYVVQIGRKGKCKGKGVYASLFGVGAPEALVIGVVALLVFGPKGLAEVARNIGKTLRTFQPTIRELQDVSREFKSTLEREIGLDEIKKDMVRPTIDPGKAYTTEDYLKIFQENQKKEKEMESSETQADPQEGLSQDNSPSSSETSNKEQLDGQKEASTENLVESKGQKQGTGNAETQEYLKKLEEEVNAVIAEKRKKAAAEVKSPVSDAQEATSLTPPSEKPESET